MKKSSPLKNVLWDATQAKYLKKPNSDQSFPTVTDQIQEAWTFCDREIQKAWRIAYKAAWLGIGQFFFYGVKISYQEEKNPK
ncbi:hypothetical protein ACRW9N_10780 [Listeria aquatica]|uniref:hypothetical protein n=1 Tax=Listeria aquatica TaxID=1494960 RepID=UPI003EF94A99